MRRLGAMERSSLVQTFRQLHSSRHSKKAKHHHHHHPHHAKASNTFLPWQHNKTTASSTRATQSPSRRITDNIPAFNTSHWIGCHNVPGGCQGGGLGNATYQQLADERVRWTATANLSRKEIVLTAAQKQYLHDILSKAKEKMHKDSMKRDRDESATNSKSRRPIGRRHKNRVSKRKRQLTTRRRTHTTEGSSRRHYYSRHAR